MSIDSAVIIIKNDKVFIPVLGKTKSGLYIDNEPVFICDVDKGQILENIKNVYDIGHPLLQILNSSDRKEHEKVMLKATGARSWKELGRTGICYTLGWGNQLVVTFSRLDKRGRWEYDPNKTKKLALDTSIEEVIQLILDDYYSRPMN